ncbi:MAG: S9 family peptidase [Steroidobacteraceae bacterium]
MQRHLLFFATVILLGLDLTASAQQAARNADGKLLFGTDAALRVAEVSSPVLSPDKTRVAYLVQTTLEPKDKPWKAVTQIWVTSAAGPASAARQYTRGDESATQVRWSPDGNKLGFISSAGTAESAKPQVWFMYANGGSAWLVTTLPGGVQDFAFSPDGKSLLLVAGPKPNPAHLLEIKDHSDAAVVDHDPMLSQLWLWDIASGKAKQLTNGDFTVSDPQWSPNGQEVLFVTRPTPSLEDGSRATEYVLNLQTSHTRLLGPTADYVLDARWSPDGATIAFLATPKGEQIRQQVAAGLYLVPATGGTPRALTFPLGAGTPVWAPDGQTIYFSTGDHEAVAVFAVNVASGAVRRLSRQAADVRLDHISPDGSFAIGTWSDPTHPAEVFRANLDFTVLHNLTDQNQWLAGYALGNATVLKWKSSADGMEIEGVVTEPVGFDASRKYPFLLSPHGGPTGATTLSFNPTEQILAANGYLVLEPNFRGSSGRGLPFATADENDWGGGDFHDDMSGVDAVIAKGWADPNRMGEFGWSYGGYMSYWIDTHTRRFRAISPGAGLTDLYPFYSQTDIHSYLKIFFKNKDPWDLRAEYWDHSPMKYVEDVTTPTMILEGLDDHRVPIAQQQEFYRALSDRHVPVEFVTYPREHHGFVEPRHIQDRWRRYLVFFGHYLDNEPVTEPAPTLAALRHDLPGAATAAVTTAANH